MAGVSVHEAEIMLHNDYKALRAEYTRLRDIAQKRLDRLGKSEFSESKAYTSHKNGFAKLRDISKGDLAKAFSELSKFVNAKTSTVSGQKSTRAKTIATWRKQGLGVTPQNYNRVIQILEELRKRKITYGSDKVVSLADSMMSLDDQQTNQWLDHLDELLPHADELQEIPDLQGYDFDEILDMIGE